MTVKELINAAYQTANGKARTLNPGNARYERLLAIANMAAAQWESEPGIVWKSRCQEVYIGDIDHEEVKYRLPANVRMLELEKLLVIRSDTQQWTRQFVPYDRLRSSGEACWLGDSVEIRGVTREMDGAEIFVPAIVRLPKMEQPDDRVLVDDPNWLIFMMAAEFVRNSRTKQNQYGNLVAMAQASMEGMKYRNSYRMDVIPRENIWP